MTDREATLETFRERVGKLSEHFSRQAARYRGPTYNEETARSEFISPFFEALGWDVANRQGHALQYRDVVHEEGIKVGDATKAPDYTFRIGGQRKFFVEAKKPGVDLKHNPAPAYQLRRYAWSANLPLSILTDFDELGVYDTRVRPKEGEKASVARVFYFDHEGYVDRAQEIWEVFSKRAVLQGSFDAYVEDKRRKRGTSEVDAEFLKEIEGWREELAKNIALRNPGLTVDELNYAVQATIDRVLFLRIAEGRGAEDYARLLALVNGPGIYERLMALYRQADERYNSGVFDFKADKLTPGLSIDDKVLKPILSALYYPQSPYEFSVLPAEILGNVYEQFLGKVIRLTPSGRAKVEEKPEVKKAGGVYYTPSYIVDYIVAHTVGKLVEGKAPKEMAKLRIVDPACGSGSFLLVAYQTLLDAHLAWYRDHEPKKHKQAVFEGPGGDWRLTTAKKREILLDSIYGVDIDRQAVEVTKLSLLLKCLEGETNESLRQLNLYGERALPSLEKNIQCGNSLISPQALLAHTGGLFPDEQELRRINPFDWQKGFPKVLSTGGFDAVLGNPPYLNVDTVWGKEDVRLQVLRDSFAGVYADKTDLLFYFLARAIELSRNYVCFIVSRAFLEAFKAARLRRTLATKTTILRIIDFQDFRVFDGVGITTAILELGLRKGRSDVDVAKLHCELRPPFNLERQSRDVTYFDSFRVPRQDLGEAPWVLVPKSAAFLNQRIDEAGEPLGSVLRIGQGMQTGLNNVFGRRTREELERWGAPDSVWIRRASNSDIRPYSIRDRGEFLLYLEEVESFRDLPIGIRRYLESHRAELEARAAFQRGDCEWWRYTWPLHKEWYSGQRLLCPFLARTNRFALDSDRAYLGLTDTTVLFSHGQKESLEYIVALLNSALLTYRFRSIGKLKGGGILEYFWNSVSKLPLRRIIWTSSSDESIHARLGQLARFRHRQEEQKSQLRTQHDRALLERQVAATDAEIDQLVFKLYHLTPKDTATVKKT